MSTSAVFLFQIKTDKAPRARGFGRTSNVAVFLTEMWGEVQAS